MSYSLAFVESALKDWRKLAPAIAEPFKKTNSERLAEPRVHCARLHHMPDCHKIKLRTVVYRSVHQVDDTAVTVPVVAVGKREKSEVYRAARESESEWLTDGKDEAATERCVETAGLLEWGMNLALFSLYPTKLACSARKPHFVRNFAELRSKPPIMPTREATFEAADREG